MNKYEAPLRFKKLLREYISLEEMAIPRNVIPEKQIAFINKRKHSLKRIGREVLELAQFLTEGKSKEESRVILSDALNQKSYNKRFESKISNPDKYINRILLKLFKEEEKQF